MKKNKKDLLKDILDAHKESRLYDDEHLYSDHINWLMFHFNEGNFEFPEDYDYDTNVWTIGLLISQLERYNGVVMKTNKGYLPKQKGLPIE